MLIISTKDMASLKCVDIPGAMANTINKKYRV